MATCNNELTLAHLLQNHVEELIDIRPTIYFGGLREDKYSFLSMFKSFVPCLYKQSRFLNSLAEHVYIETKKQFCKEYGNHMSEKECEVDYLSSDLIINTKDKLFIIEYVGGVHHLYARTFDRDAWILNMNFKKMFVDTLSSYKLDKELVFIIVEEKGEDAFIKEFSEELIKHL